MEISFIIILLAAIFNLMIGFFVLLNNYRKRTNQIFFIFSFSIGLWILTNFFSGVYHNIFWLKSAYAFGPLVALTGLVWVMNLCETRLSKFKLFLSSVLGIVFFFLSYFDELIVSNVKEIHLGGYTGETGTIFPFYTSYVFLVFGFIVYKLFSSYRKAKDLKKTQLGYVLVGVTAWILVVSIVSFILPLFGYLQFTIYDSPSSIIFIIFTTYAITKHHLFNIKVIATEILTALMAIMLLVKIPLSNGLNELIFNLIFFHIFLVLGIFLIRTVWMEIKRAKEIEELNKEKIAAYGKIEGQAKNLQFLQKISNIILKSFGGDLQNLTQKILNMIDEELPKYTTILLGLASEDKKYLNAYTLSQSKNSKFILDNIGKSIQSFGLPIDGDKTNLYLETYRQKKTMRSNSISDFVSPPLPKSIAGLIQKTTGIKSIVSFPVFKGDELKGVLGFALKKPIEQISKDDYDLLQAMTDQISIAIEKTSVYKELQKNNEELKLVNRDLKELLEMKTEFMRTASHQLRTPISAVKGMLSMLVEGSVAPEKQAEFIKMAYEGSEKISIIIKDILAATSLDAGHLDLQLRKVDLANVLREVIAEHRFILDEKSLKLNHNIPEGLPEITADPYWIKEVFNNLLENAIFYTKNGEINMNLKNDSAGMKITIEDTGAGITPKDKERLFKKFTRGKNATSIHPDGSGLGLYIAKNIIDFHKGTIKVESEGEGQGTVVEVVLPKK